MAQIKQTSILLNQMNKLIVAEIGNKIIIGDRPITITPEFNDLIIEQNEKSFNIVLNIKNQRLNTEYQKPQISLFVDNKFIYQGYRRQFDWDEFQCSSGQQIFGLITVYKQNQKYQYKTKSYEIHCSETHVISLDDFKKRQVEIDELSGEQDQEFYELKNGIKLRDGFPIYLIPSYDIQTYVPTPNQQVELQVVNSKEVDISSLMFDIVSIEDIQFQNLKQIFMQSQSYVFWDQQSKKITIMIDEFDESKTLLLRIKGRDLDYQEGQQLVPIFNFKVKSKITEQAQQLSEYEQQPEQVEDQEQQPKQLNYQTYDLYEINGININQVQIKLYKNCWFYNNYQLEYQDIFSQSLQQILNSDCIDFYELVNYLCQCQINENNGQQLQISMQQYPEYIQKSYVLFIQDKQKILFSHDQQKLIEMLSTFRVLQDQNQQPSIPLNQNVFLHNIFEAKFKIFNSFLDYLTIQRDKQQNPTEIIPQEQYQLSQNTVLVLFNQKTLNLIKIFTSQDQEFIIPKTFGGLSFNLFDIYGKISEGIVQQQEILRLTQKVILIDQQTQNQVTIIPDKQIIQIKSIQDKYTHEYSPINSQIQLSSEGTYITLNNGINVDQICLEAEYLNSILQMFEFM